MEPRLQHRLRTARRQALESIAEEPAANRAWWLSAGLIGSAAVVVLSLSIWLAVFGPISQAPIPSTALSLEHLDVEDIAILVEAEEPDFYQNLEFLQWLEEQDDVS